MPPLAITKGELTRLVAITAESIRVAVASAYPQEAPATLGEHRERAPAAGPGRAAA